MSEEARARSPVKAGDVVGGKYRVERILGAGGMGVVVAATHTELDQAVALKFILPEAVSGKDAIERFMREARAVAKLKSEHVARVYDVGRDANDNPYMVLELLEGLDLAKLNKQKGPLTVADSVEYVLQACEALVEAHAAGIVHRDLKPQNLFVSRRLNGMPLVKVLDFGIAKAIGAAAVGQMALTDSQAVMGSPLYMAPEHMRSARAADIRSDIWSLGVILYELLGGQLPFDGETVTEVCIRVVNEPPASLLSLRPGLDQALVTIVMRCLEKDPMARFQNVAQLATALEPYSRSAKQGVVLRPWKSFEDTLDSHPPHAAATPAPAAAITADDTGPSTAITMPTNEQLKNLRQAPDSFAKVRAVAPAASPAAPAPLALAPPVRPLVQTDVTWGQGTDPRTPMITTPPPARSFTTGMLVGGFAAVAAVIAVLVVAFRPAATTTTTAYSAAPPAETSTLPTARPSATTSTEVAAPPPLSASSDAVTTPASLPNAPVASANPAKRVPFMPSGRARPPSAPVAPPAETTAAPNGAPILR